MRRAESQQYSYRRLHPADQQSQVGAGTGNVHLSLRQTGLPKDSVANVSQVVSVDKSFLIERVGRLSPQKLELLLNGIDIVLGR